MIEINLYEQEIAPIIQLSRCTLAALCFASELWWVFLRLEGVGWLYWSPLFCSSAPWCSIPSSVQSSTLSDTAEDVSWHCPKYFVYGSKLNVGMSRLRPGKQICHMPISCLCIIQMEFCPHLLPLWLNWYVFSPTNISVSLFCKWIFTFVLPPWISFNLSLSLV